MQTGHYTQVVWKDTTLIGCAFNLACRTMDFLVCQYKSPGNYQGQFQKQACVRGSPPAPKTVKH